MFKTTEDGLVVYRAQLAKHKEWATAAMRICGGGLVSKPRFQDNLWTAGARRDPMLLGMSMVLGLTEEEIVELDREAGLDPEPILGYGA